MGYRWYDAQEIQPMYAFGHGLSYTSFEYVSMQTGKNRYKPSDEVSVIVRLKNTGTMAAEEVVQLYVNRPESEVEFPPKELKAFRRVRVAPGKTARVTLTFPVNALQHWDEALQDWALEPGTIELWVGTSSDDIRLKKSVAVGF